MLAHVYMRVCVCVWRIFMCVYRTRQQDIRTQILRNDRRNMEPKLVAHHEFYRIDVKYARKINRIFCLLLFFYTHSIYIYLQAFEFYAINFFLHSFALTHFPLLTLLSLLAYAIHYTIDLEWDFSILGLVAARFFIRINHCHLETAPAIAAAAAWQWEQKKVQSIKLCARTWIKYLYKEMNNLMLIYCHAQLSESWNSMIVLCILRVCACECMCIAYDRKV